MGILEICEYIQGSLEVYTGHIRLTLAIPGSQREDETEVGHRCISHGFIHRGRYWFDRVWH